MDDFIATGEQMLLYVYRTKKLTQTDKVRFYYALKGRNGKGGIVKDLKIQQLAKTVLLIPWKYEEEADAFFQLWNLPFTKRRVLVAEAESFESK